MFRKPTKKTAVQSRQRDENKSSGDEVETDVIKDTLKRKRRNNPMVQSTKKRNRDDDCDSSTSSGDDDAPILAEHAFAASGTSAPLGPSDQGATATLDIDTDFTADAQAQFERVQQQLKDGLEKDGKTLYKGQAMYGAKQAKDTAKGNASSGLNRMGPVRAPQFLRQTVRWDFAPDICKDYKETGFCTFGDSCKFLHDRSDYKHGWEVERDFLNGRLNQVDDTNYEIADDDDQLPDDCFICGKPFDTPVVTRCKHYFCESCAIQAFRKSKKCRVCDENTGGVFNVAKEIIQKINGVSKRKAADEDESDSGEDDDGHANHEGDEHGEHVHGDGCSHEHFPEAEGDGVDLGEDAEQEEGDDAEVEIKMEDVDNDVEEGNQSDDDVGDEEDAEEDTSDKE